MTSAFIAGGAGFIGSHLVRRLLKEERYGSVVVYDNFCSGKRSHLAEIATDPRLGVVEGDINDEKALLSTMSGAEHVFHLAANADIAAAATDPGVDFRAGTVLTHLVLEAARRCGVRRFTYTSGSGVYGDQGEHEVDESFGPLLPISTYGASKLAGEGLVSAYSHLFALEGVALRFANVVGPRQTHGVVFDFVRKLLRDPTHLEVLGDGTQSKSYIHVDDVLDAVFLAGERANRGFDVYNVGTDEYVTVQEIVELVCSEMGLDAVEVTYGTSPRGWKGDVPVVRFSSGKIRALGWANRYSTSEALLSSIRASILEAGAI